MASHTRCGVVGMSRWRTPNGRSASITAEWTAGVEPMVPDSPIALGAERVEERRRLHVDELEAGQLGRRGEGVVGQVGRDRVAVLVVAHLLEQRLRRALRDAAVDLALEQERVEHPPGVVARDLAQVAHLAGLRVDLDHGDVAAEGEGGAGRGEGLGRARAPPSPAAAAARSAHDLLTAGVPATWKTPLSTSSTMSAASASSRRAATSLAFSTSASAATWTAVPPCCSEREPIVPPPLLTRSVSPQTTSILSIGMPVLGRRDHRPGRDVALPVRRGAGVDDGPPVVEDLDAGRPRAAAARRP